MKFDAMMTKVKDPEPLPKHGYVVLLAQPGLVPAHALAKFLAMAPPDAELVAMPLVPAHALAKFLASDAELVAMPDEDFGRYLSLMFRSREFPLRKEQCPLPRVTFTIHTADGSVEGEWPKRA